MTWRDYLTLANAKRNKEWDSLGSISKGKQTYGGPW